MSSTTQKLSGKICFIEFPWIFFFHPFLFTSPVLIGCHEISRVLVVSPPPLLPPALLPLSSFYSIFLSISLFLLLFLSISSSLCLFSSGPSSLPKLLVSKKKLALIVSSFFKLVSISWRNSVNEQVTGI